MPGRAALTIPCPAKVNLALSIGAPDPARDNLHPIASWMVTLGFGDTLTLRALENEQQSVFDLRYAEDAPRPEAIDWPLQQDLAFRAHALIERHVGRALPVHATIEKRIPTGAGLGGGSSDAAGMLAGLNRLFDLRLPPARLREIAGQLGSDVVFLTAALAEDARGALVTGTGEALEPATPRAPLDLVLILPPHHCPTGPVYRAFDALCPAGRVDQPRVRTLTRQCPLDPASLFNDLAAAAEHVCPPLATLRDSLQNALQQPIHITGSGAVMFTLAASSEHAADLAAMISQDHAVAALATTTG
jgi:4-diphosphocytidyl-2-C-methyl-D-erythritol kinase